MTCLTSSHYGLFFGWPPCPDSYTHVHPCGILSSDTSNELIIKPLGALTVTCRMGFIALLLISAMYQI